MPTDAARARLATLLREHALVRESVVLSSGRRSSYYFDARQVLLDPEGAALSGALAWGALGPASRGRGRPHAGGRPLVCAVSAAAWAQGRRVTGFFVRKEAKKHGLQQWIEGPFIEETPVPSSTTCSPPSPGSPLTATEVARQAGGAVVAALVVVDRGEGGRDAVQAVLGDAPLHALFTAPELRGRAPLVVSPADAAPDERPVVLQVSGPTASVWVAGEEVEALVARRLPGGPPVAGDRVELRGDGDRVTVVGVAPRRSLLARGEASMARPLAANADLLIVASAAAEPPWRRR